LGTPICGCGSTAECGRAKAETTVRLRSPAPFRGRSSSAEHSFDMREAKRAALFAPTIFQRHGSASQSGCFTCIRSKARILLPSPFLSLWCSPVNMPASHAGDHRSEAGRGRQLIAPKASSAMPSLGKRISPVQLRVRAPAFGGRPQGPQPSQRSSGFHTPAVSGAAPEAATISASTQQPADFFCKEFLPEHHRLEAPFRLLA
jgi:hypothetical protein